MNRLCRKGLNKVSVTLLTVAAGIILTGTPVFAQETTQSSGTASVGSGVKGNDTGSTTMKAIVTSDDAAAYTIKIDGAIAKISVGGLKGYVILSADRTKAGIYVNGEQVFSINVDAEGTGTTKINSIGVGNIGMDASAVHSMTYDDIAASTSSYAEIATYTGADTLFVNTVTTGTPGVMKTSGSTAVKAKETVYQNGKVLTVLEGGPINYASALTDYEISYITPQDAIDNLDKNRVQFVIHHKDYSRQENVYNDVYGYQDASGAVIFYENVVTTKNTATAAQAEVSTWYRRGTDGKYYTVDLYGNITDTETGYHYDLATNSMISG
ncbi:MAG: hypothetical protein KA965_10690 [Butyrivibrio sp.]|nr:hypothetical protein [Butyrivibrio sp.]